MEIGRYDISDVLSCLPEIGQLENADLRECDIFVSTLGFEERAPNLINRFAQAGSLKGASVVLIEYPTNELDNEANLKHFEKAAESAAFVHRIRYSRGDYFSRLKEIVSAIKTPSSVRVVFDITTCSSYVFYPTMKALMELDGNLSLVYSEASAYYPAQDEWEVVAQKANQETSLFIESFEKAEFQSIGVEDVYSSSLFSDMNAANRPTTFVAVPNFSASRMNALVTRDQEMNKTSSRNTYWLIGEPPSSENHWRVDAVRLTNNLSVVDNAKLKFVSTLDYKEMIKTLEDIWLETKHSFYLSIGTLGSKMQHVGTFFFLYLHKDVGLLLTEPKTFRGTRYSSGVGQSWQLCFDETSELRKALRQYLVFRWKL
jgi:hypothetical protein